MIRHHFCKSAGTQACVEPSGVGRDGRWPMRPHPARLAASPCAHSPIHNPTTTPVGGKPPVSPPPKNPRSFSAFWEKAESGESG